MNIQKVVLKDGKYPKIHFSNVIGDNDIKCSKPAHDDFIEAMAELDIHLALLSGQILVPADYIERVDALTADIVLNAEERAILNNIETTGFSLTSGQVSVSIIGSRILGHTNKSLSLDSPPQIFEGDPYHYPFNQELILTIDKIKYEANEYLNGKNGNAMQLELGFEDGGQTDVKTVTVKKRGRKKKEADAEVDPTDTISNEDID